MWMDHGALKLTAQPPKGLGGLVGSVAAQSRPRHVEGACVLGFIPIGVVRGFKMAQGRPTRQGNFNFFLEGQSRLNKCGIPVIFASGYGRYDFGP